MVGPTAGTGGFPLVAHEHASGDQVVSSASAQTPAGGGLSEELSKLAALRNSGVLTDHEFAAAKARLLGA